ncbi:hypothetical protein B5M47_01670 [candidate division CPR3 bacterium 4484_211]|uniref:Uncharacterized protein n=1 Tax=candidate division CPR3 bacterium 4484_211 TaxID=1968527 RepID=A0A1W9NYR4_UNCC3|nr:MAG: hypothetical protein B5M47_01670 [candidate division CPR3 bacterium 4484_211]
MLGAYGPPIILDMSEEKNAVAQYYLTSPHKKAKDFRSNNNYKQILALALKDKIKANDVYQNTSVAEGEKQRGRVIGTMLKNLVKWGFLVKTGEKDSLYRQEIFSLNESLRRRIQMLVEK